MLNVVHVGGGSEISCRRQRAIASAGLSHSLWLVSPASWIGVWPSGARATKKRVSKRLVSISGVTQCAK
jgi:hypothetical protein